MQQPQQWQKQQCQGGHESCSNSSSGKMLGALTLAYGTWAATAEAVARGA